MHIEFQNLLRTITSICEQTCSLKEINQLAKFCLKIAISYLHILEARGQRIRETRDKNELHGIASDCIADLFTQNKSGNFPYLQRYFSPQMTEDLKDDDFFISLRKLITQKVSQHLSKLYAQRDPEGAKLIRNIRLSAKRFQELQIARDATGEYISILKTEIRDDRIHRPNYLDLHNAFSFIFQAEYCVDKLVHKVLYRLSNDFECFVEIRILDLVKLIKEYRSAVEKNEQANSITQPSYYFGEVELKKKVMDIVAGLNKKISDKYVIKNKLSLDEGIAMSKALKEIAINSLEGERLQENYYYLQKYWISLSREEYYKSVRKIFEYLVRLFKDEIRKIVLNNSE